MTHKFQALMVSGALTLMNPAADAQVVNCTPVDPQGDSAGPWYEGACGINHSTDPESWVRGYASVDFATG